jgi:multiple sugar transport system ATP-binding protein
VEAKDRNLAMVFQSYALYPHMTVYENISFALKIAGMDKATIDQKVRRTAELLQLTELLNRKPSQLSGGQRQRVAMGRAMVRNPVLFLFDEPLSNLDAKLRTQMREELKDIHHKLKTTTIYVTHDQIEAMTLADRIVILRDGVVEQVGTPTEVFLRPANIFVAGFIGSPGMNFFEGKVAGSAEQPVLDLGTCQIPAPPAFRRQLRRGSELTVGIRPSDIHLGPNRPAQLPAQVVGTEIHGAEVMVKGRLGTRTFHFQTPLALAPIVGEVEQCSFDLDALHLFDRESGQALESVHG